MIESQHNTPLVRSISIQLRVISALLMREILTRYGRHNVGFLWIFLEPMTFTVGVTTLWNLVKAEHVASISITAFALTGYSAVLVWRNCTTRCALAILPNQSLLYHRNVRVVDFFWARILLEISGATMSCIILSVIYIIVGWMEPPKDISLVLAGWLYLSVFGAALALTIGSLTERSEMVERLWHTIAYLVFPLSGSAFMVEWLPEAWRKYALLVPMVNGTEMLRAGFFGSVVKTHYDVTYMVFVDATLLFVGLFFTREAGKRVQPD
ncbi:MAG: ABC transporter permease [Burkholderia sp.]|jgi:capsular polysaccharide transport system permease protein|uniref:ABC transporter permease n=1 Tax=Burkholderia arboris TaxID=488730 RepID=A0A9Q9US74_9BURK|nr:MULTISPECIES: ABC transporter permease [Burkholderia]ALX12888.1 sugar ABC transporter permease [Burkholderia cepacia JBK9]MCA3777348.1 ABC transporter permease [Burkholderia sp.]MCA3798199.1 ABC transporter permease [Burkholderia sp.]MCA3806852.1 ABC transporter permease [Burkholderia sp.]MCA3816082.1 ABC transporter permease [Burkholderia sp.]